MDYYKLKVLNNKRRIIIICIFLTICMILSFYYFFYYKNINNDEEIIEREVSDDLIAIDDKNNFIYVDIKGYVSMPGVYSFNVEDNARINDLILKAGGLKKDADTSMLNLSKKLEDEMAVIIYSKSEVENYTKTQELLKNKLEICELKLSNNACIKEENNKSNNNIVNINSATKEELMTLNGIGENKAEAIIEYRSKNAFQDIKDILNVEGIGDNLFESIKNYIKV